MTNLIGRQLGQYQITGYIGAYQAELGLAAVYTARQTSIGRDVAIKVVESRQAADPNFVRRFEREARTIATLNHPHIVKLFDFGQQDELLYLVMEYQAGGELNDLIRKAPLAPGAAARLLDQIASALDYAHSRGVIHRDLRPGNVLLDQSGNAILTNFSIAWLYEDPTEVVEPGYTMGTPAYMPPEQWRGQATDGQTDVYALGATLYEMLTGKQPFTADTPYQLRDAHLSAPPPSVLEIRPDLPRGVDGVIQKAMDKEKTKRYNSASELASAFRQAIAGDAPQLENYQIVERLKAGGMAVVFRARQLNIRRDVAIKIVESQIGEDPDFARRFEREARAMVALNHPNIVKVFDFGQKGAVLYLVMELHTGGNLQDLIRQAPMAPDAAARVLDQVASALDYAHSRGVIHRDLKPSNVLLDEGGNAILTDFGLARMVPGW